MNIKNNCVITQNDNYKQEYGKNDKKKSAEAWD